MVLCNLHIVSLKHGISHRSFLGKLRRNGVNPVIQARVVRWMILPSQMSSGHLLGRNISWDLLLILEGKTSFPQETHPDIEAVWSAMCVVSDKSLSGYAATNTELMHPPLGTVIPPELHADEPSMPSSSSSSSFSSSSPPQNLEVSLELSGWIASLPRPLREHPISMLNLLAFRPGKKDQYKQYHKAFASEVGARHGGRVKLVGRVTGGQAQGDGWDEISFVHYPSIQHFAAMTSSRNYQKVNHEYRLGALKDTFTLCVVEVDDNGDLINPGPVKEKL
ncbi:uncharacterized protein GGS25DRAFT_473832 [Hypoxylon fragiforme]|uniref:uncharacterized protein n=1 Tax=Hypoxylon fragiforme TaxID=63214 RepID=UPI0020C66D10|nr:uncharacterized protein GGS25DRAFT_512169 [Hypoxylon fragiforme]XP_049119677.1 uncharacterized protein GGS25DRAFT_473832 [Hypoxylon fragiforme]KAI2602705.1 hypothetical protein GGS25DRAFT_512169 [Hypoxylon fragiforme]KAI2612112.1 hypothetical protein GGS25DRAFT_473832 [Hypoxylon fragiforme]